MTFKVYLKQGLGGPFITEAENADKAAAFGLSEYRRNLVSVDFKPIEKVVDHVELIEAKA